MSLWSYNIFSFRQSSIIIWSFVIITKEKKCKNKREMFWSCFFCCCCRRRRVTTSTPTHNKKKLFIFLHHSHDDWHKKKIFLQTSFVSRIFFLILHWISSFSYQEWKFELKKIHELLVGGWMKFQRKKKI